MVDGKAGVTLCSFLSFVAGISSSAAHSLGVVHLDRPQIAVVMYDPWTFVQVSVSSHIYRAQTVALAISFPSAAAPPRDPQPSSPDVLLQLLSYEFVAFQPSWTNLPLSVEPHR
jgi:hypothetical protein